MNKINRSSIYEKEWGRAVISILMTGAFFAIITIVCPRVFFINDDENIMYTLAGYYTYGEPYDHSFINFCLSYVLRRFYRLMPSLPWYAIFHIGVLAVSVVLIFKTILKETYRKKLPLLIGLLINTALFSTVYIFPTTLMQFTTTSAFAGAAAATVLLGVDFKHDQKEVLIVDLAMSVIMLLVCYALRKNSGYVAICFYFGTLLYIGIRVFKRDKKAVIKLGCTALAVVLLLFSMIGIDKWKRSSDEWNAFYEYDEARFKCTDYPHDSYKDNPELYESLDWTPELYELGMTSWWFFMDPRINVESFQAIAETGYYKPRRVNLNDMFSIAKDTITSNDVAIIASVFCGITVLLFAYLFVISKKKKEQVLDFIYGICIIGGGILLCAYLCYRQRFPLRAFHTVCLPFTGVFTVTLIRVWDPPVLERVKKAEMVMQIILCAFVIIFSSFFNTKTSIDEANSRVEKSMRTIKVEEYAIEHPGSIYIYDASLTFRYLPFTRYLGTYPSNLFFWGGMGWNSPAFNNQVFQNGLPNLYSDVFFNDNVYYVSYTNYLPEKPLSLRMEQYMDRTYGDCKFIQVDTISEQDGIYVYMIKK